MKEKITPSWIEVELAKVNMTIEKWPDIIYYSTDKHKYKELLELAKEKLEQCKK